MIVTKNQIRPRRQKFHFSNAEVLLLDTVGHIQLVPPAPSGQALALLQIQMQANLAAVYASVDAASSLLFFDDFDGIARCDEDPQGAVTSLLGAVTSGSAGLNLLTLPLTLFKNSSNVCVAGQAFEWIDRADIAANGGIYLAVSNSGDFTGGDPANFLDIFVDYKIVNL